MKKCLIITIALWSFIFINPSAATVHIINAQGTTIPTDIFVPKITNALVGDTITWVWVSGVHTTESISIPAGAASWSSNLNSSTTTFSYIVTVAGTYDYDCHASTPHGMNGTIEVADVTGIPLPGPNRGSSAFPNPFSDKIIIESTIGDKIFVYNLSGQKLRSIELKNGQTKTEIDLSGHLAGIYFYSILKEGRIVETRKLLKK